MSTNTLYINEKYSHNSDPSGSKKSTWYITNTFDNPIQTVNGQSTFTIPYPVLTARYENPSPSTRNSGYIRVPVSLCKYSSPATHYFTHVPVYSIGTTRGSATSANWSPSTEKTLIRRYDGVPKTGALTKNISDYFNSTNPTTRTVNLDLQWWVHSEDYKYSGDTQSKFFANSYFWKSSGITYSQYYDNTDDGVYGNHGYISTQLQVTLNAPPTATGSTNKSTYNYGETVTVNVSGTAQYGGNISSCTVVMDGSANTKTGSSASVSYDNLSPGNHTVQVYVKDSRGQTSSTVTVGTITVNQAQPPTVSVSTSATTYDYGSDITVNVVASPASGASINSILLKIGNAYSKTVYSSGAYVFQNCTTTGAFSVTATATDNQGQSATATAPSQITINQPKNPEFTVVNGGPPAGSYDAGTTYSCTVANIRTYQGSSIASIVLAIGTATDSRQLDGTLTVLLPDAGTYTPVVTVTDSDGRSTSQNLATISIRNNAIYIATLSAQRIDSASFLPSDSGTNALLTARFVVKADTFRPPVVKLNGTVHSATWYRNYSNTTGFSGELTSSDWTSLASGSTVYAKVVDTFNTNEGYALSVTPVAANAGEGTPLGVYLPQEFFLFAGRAGGRALGIGQKPSGDNMFEVVMASYFLNGIAGFFLKGNDGIMHQFLDLVYPVNSYYETSDSTFNPNTLWGGTWTKTADEGRYRWHRLQ